MDDDAIDEALRRLSPGIEPGRLKAMAADPATRGLFSLFDFDVAALNAERRAGLWAVLQAARYFGPLGWAVSAYNLEEDTYIEAVAAWEARHDMGEIDRVLTAGWSNKVWLRHSFGPMTIIAETDDELDLLLMRNELLTRALEHHLRGEYDASILIVLSQIDGLTYDYSGTGGFFADTKGVEFVDAKSIAGMPDVLETVWKAVIRADRATSGSTQFLRAPIMHGRYPAFGTETNSAKAFALLSIVVEWLRAKVGKPLV